MKYRKKSKSTFKNTFSKTKKLLCSILCITICFAMLSFIIADSQIPAEEVLSKLGSQGDEVRRVQQKLRELGFVFGDSQSNFIFATRLPAVS